VNWPVGTIVVCVDNRPDPYEINDVDDLHLLSEGSYYTIAEWGHGHEFDDGLDSVRINEVTVTDSDGFYSARRFRRAESSHSESSTARQSSEAK
jgi:hypothetical protein